MGRALLLCLILSALSGCATLSYPLPKCDGYAKRPLNRSMWEWESGKGITSQKHSSLSNESGKALAFAETVDASVAQTASAGFDVAASYRACQAG
ncbi:type IV secretion system protein VirB7 [Brucella intermedia]|uniref:type IV secretion system protein VirB7 n=1 Tax=Brucella intermedia TaxID=94625 RepID=UPI00224A9921|nr:type IV secretion system protein VirB7 [Brucella intermedia]